MSKQVGDFFKFCGLLTMSELYFVLSWIILFHKNRLHTFVQVNLCQKLLFLHQLTHNMTTDCSLNYKFNTWKSQAQNMGRTCCVQKLFLTFRTFSVHNMFFPCSAKIRASDKDLPVWTLTKSKSLPSNSFFVNTH